MTPFPYVVMHQLFSVPFDDGRVPCDPDQLCERVHGGIEHNLGGIETGTNFRKCYLSNVQ